MLAFLSALAALVAAPVNVIDVGGGNALTLPAARHLVRLDPQNGKPAAWLLAVQQDGASGHWLSMYRSDDEAQSWHWYAGIQDTSADRDTPDMLVVGMDVALVYSYEGPSISGSTAHDVYFQWWRWNGNADWFPQPAVRVFDSTSSSTAYLRGELARDSLGRLWVWAQRLNSDGTFTMVLSVSSDGGATFQAQPSLDSFANRPGGRIVPVAGNKLMLLYGTHGTDPGYMRLRNDSDPVGTWGARQMVFPEGLYHGAALSAVNDGSGGVHLVYKDVNEQLWYRRYSAGAWSARQQVESASDWALQPAITRVGNAVVIFWNRVVATNTAYQFYYRILTGSTLGTAVQLAGTGGFRGYPASADVLPTSVAQVPCLFGNTVDANSSGSVALVFAPNPGPTPPTPPPPPPPPSPTPTTLFTDNFNRTGSDLGSSWQIKAGFFRADGQRADSDLDATDQAAVIGLSCADCTVQARVVNFAAAPAVLDVREVANNDRYDVALTGAGRLQIRRHNGSTTTILGDVASGVADLGNWATIALQVSGYKPVTLVASVNGAQKLTVTDSSTQAIAGPGTAGISTSVAGIWFDDFVVTGYAPATDGGTPDAGTPDAGTDAGTPDAGTDAGTPDAGTPDAGTPDAGHPDAGTDAGTPDAGTDAGTPDAGTDAGTPDAGTGTLFFDDFNRTASTLGTRWTVQSGAWIADTRANSDLDTLNRATAAGVTCTDCRIDARMVNFAGGESMLELRVNGANRYALALTAAGRLEIRRYSGTSVTVLGSVASGIADLGGWSSFTFSVQGSSPVTLTGSVNGAQKLSVSDSSTSRYTGAGGAGIAATMAGIWIDDFKLTGPVSGGGGSDAGTPDAGTPDAGTPDAGTPDAGTPDAGTPDSGTPDAGSDGGTPDAGTGTIFFDDFNRTISNNLGTGWTVLAGAWRTDNRANSDLDTLDRAVAAGVSCADCRIDAKVVNFAAADAMLELRVNGGNRYALALTGSGTLQIRRYAGTSVTVLGSAASGISDLTNWSSVSFAVQGGFPVTLTAYVNGAPKLSATDSSSSAYTGSGGAGIATTLAGILFDDFKLTGAVSGGGGGGTPDAGTPDAGTPDAGAGGANLTVQTTYTSTGYDLLAVDPAGIAYGVNLNGSSSRIYTSTDGRTWVAGGSAGGSFLIVTALSDGTLLADVDEGGTHVIARSTDSGATWTDVLALGNYRALTPHSFAELDGAAYFLEYQVFTGSSTPIRLWKSTNRGATWTAKYTFQGHRHGHGLVADPARHALFALFGDTDAQSAIVRSTDGGTSWTTVKSGVQGADLVDAALLGDGSLLAGQDISYVGSTPNRPQIARIALDGTETDYVTLPSASYSTHAIESGGYVVGTTHEESNDVEAPGWTRGTLWGSGDGVHWAQLLTVTQAVAGQDVRCDVYWELPSGELVLSVRNAAGFGPDGRGYLLLKATRQ